MKISFQINYVQLLFLKTFLIKNNHSVSPTEKKIRVHYVNIQNLDEMSYLTAKEKAIVKCFLLGIPNTSI